MSRSGIQARKKDEPRKKDERVRIMTALDIIITLYRLDRAVSRVD